MQQSSRIKYQRQRKHAPTFTFRGIFGLLLSNNEEETTANAKRISTGVCECGVFVFHFRVVILLLRTISSFPIVHVNSLSRLHSIFCVCLCVRVYVCVQALSPVLYALLNICQFSKITCFLWPPTAHTRTHTYTYRYARSQTLSLSRMHSGEEKK